MVFSGLNEYNQDNQAIDIKTKLQQGQLLIVNPRRKNGLILVKKYHGEFAGPGSVVGSWFDPDLERVIPVGNLDLIKPRTPQEKQRGYLIRRQWVKLIKQITDNPIPQERAQVILNQFENWFDTETAAQLPDEVFALLVGVLPQTIRKERDLVNRL
jgi:hypothetical protein